MEHPSGHNWVTFISVIYFSYLPVHPYNTMTGEVSKYFDDGTSYVTRNEPIFLKLDFFLIFLDVVSKCKVKELSP
jgi:hypothetical protein